MFQNDFHFQVVNTVAAQTRRRQDEADVEERSTDRALDRRRGKTQECNRRQT